MVPLIKKYHGFNLLSLRKIVFNSCGAVCFVYQFFLLILEADKRKY